MAGVAASVANAVVLLGQPPGVPASLAALPVLADAAPERGPLGGLCTLLAHAAPRWGMLLACDLPRLDAATLQRLLDAVAQHPDAVAVAYRAKTGAGRLEACCALYHPRIQPAALDVLAAPRGGLQDLLRQVRAVELLPTEAEANALTDIDTEHDLDAWGGRPA